MPMVTTKIVTKNTKIIFQSKLLEIKDPIQKGNQSKRQKYSKKMIL